MANPILDNGQASPQSIYDEYKVTLADGNKNRAEGHHPVGSRARLEDGRVYYYCSNGTVALTAATLCTVPVTTGLNVYASDDKIIMTNSYVYFTAGTTSCVIDETDLDTADLVKNLYKDGYLYVEKVTGLGHSYKIKSHSEFDVALTRTSQKVELYDPIKVSLAATSEISFARNKHDRVLTSTTSSAETPVCVAPIAVSASGALATDLATAAASVSTYFFWGQTWGECCIDAGSTSVVSGAELGSGGAVDEIDIVALTSATGSTPVGGDTNPTFAYGLVTAAGAQAETVLVELRIRP